MNDEQFEMLLLALEAIGKKSIADGLRLRDSLKNGKTWVNKYPTEVGWYWLKNKGSEYVEIKKFYKNENTGQLFTNDEDFYGCYAKDVYLDHLFSGPIAKPEDQDKENPWMNWVKDSEK